MRHAWLLCLVVMVGCDDDFEVPAADGGGTSADAAPADIAGNYTLALTNQANGCGYMNWAEGQQSNDIHLNITQTGAMATGTVDGLVATYLDFAVGSHVFTGTVTGNDFEMTLFGTRSETQMMCTYTRKVIAT